jgi:hypothetical protein
MRSVFSSSQTHHLGLLNWPSQLTWSASIPSLSSSRVKCASRPAPKLRTRAGCFMCRKRRKKCDERKPRCSGCASQDFDCGWPPPGNAAAEHGRCRGENAVQRVGQIASQDMSTPPFSDGSTKFGLASCATYGLPGITTSIDHYLSLSQREVPAWSIQGQCPSYFPRLAPFDYGGNGKHHGDGCFLGYGRYTYIMDKPEPQAGGDEILQFRSHGLEERHRRQGGRWK